MAQLNTKLDERASEWLDHRIGAAERERFEAELDADPLRRREAAELGRVVEGLRRLAPVEAPPDFLRAVQSRVRRRSRNRLYGYSVRHRFPYEAVVNGILLGLLMALYLISMPTERLTLVPRGAELIRRGSAMPAVGAAVLTRYGRVEVVSASDDGGEVVYDLTLPADRLPALKEELGLFPDLELLEVATASAAAGTKRVRVRASASAFP